MAQGSRAKRRKMIGSLARENNYCWRRAMLCSSEKLEEVDEQWMRPWLATGDIGGDVSALSIRLNLYNASRRRRRSGTIQCDVRIGPLVVLVTEIAPYPLRPTPRLMSVAQLIYAKHLIAFDADVVALTKWQSSMATRGSPQ